MLSLRVVLLLSKDMDLSSVLLWRVKFAGMSETDLSLVMGFSTFTSKHRISLNGPCSVRGLSTVNFAPKLSPVCPTASGPIVFVGDPSSVYVVIAFLIAKVNVSPSINVRIAPVMSVNFSHRGISGACRVSFTWTGFMGRMSCGMGLLGLVVMRILARTCLMFLVSSCVHSFYCVPWLTLS